MANTGIKQAIIAYKVSNPGGEPLDTEGNLIRISGKKQAIALLEGHINPDPDKYEVEFYYARNETITGNPTVTRDIIVCPIGFIRVSPNRILLDATTRSALISLESSSSWYLLQSFDFATLNYSNGGPGTFSITVSGSDIPGQGEFIFKNIATNEVAKVYIVNVLTKPWVLDTGTWNMLGFWFDNGIWKYN